MRLNTEWLKELVPVSVAPADIEQRLTGLGLEVEEYVELREALHPVLVGEISSIEPIDGSDEFHVCQVDLGPAGTRQIVCGSDHPIAAGDRVPVATAGTTLPTGIEIHEARIRGVQSQGMLCLDRDMGILPKGDGLQLLGSDADPGSRFVDHVEVPDALITVSVLPNRPDCLGLVGIARELAASYGVEAVEPAIEIPAECLMPGDGIAVTIEDPAGCRRFTARVLEGVEVRKSPLWLSSRVAIAGFRPISNVVDITNLVQYEYGQPLHAFDRANLEGGEIRVRSAAVGETLTLLGEKEIALETNDLVIADATRAVGLAGIMGGVSSGVTATTRDVVLESAYFDPVRVRETSRRLQHRTEASKRFERGVDPNAGVEKAGARAAALLLQLAGGRMHNETVDVYPDPIERRSFVVPPELVERHLGFPIDGDTCVATLERLGMEHTGDYRYLVPTWRADATEKVVLIEDVFRHHGYERSPTNRPADWAAVRNRPRTASVRREIQQLMLGEGFWEARTFTFDQRARLDAFTPDAAYLDLVNPANSEMTTLRTSLVPRLLDVLAYNHRRHREPLRFFELDAVFAEHEGEVLERWVATAVASSPALDGYWQGTAPQLDFFALKGIVRRIVDRLGLDGTGLEVVPAETSIPWLDAAAAARVTFDGRDIGPIGQLDAKLAKRWELPGEIQVFELDLRTLAELQAALPRRRYRALPRFPSIDRDLSLVVPAGGASAGTLERTIRSVGGELIEAIRCYDVYEGAGIAEGARSLTFLVRYRRADRTLTSDEIAEVEERIIETLASDHQVHLRGS